MGLALLVWGVGMAWADEANSLVPEAEDFHVTKGDWSVGEIGQNYYASTWFNTFISGQMFLGAPKQGVYSEAVKEVEIPADGEYVVWTRYEYPAYFSVEEGTQFRKGWSANSVIDAKCLPKMR